jgi:preprotein translocase subunit SecA
VLRVLALDLPVAEWAKEEGIADAEIRERLMDAADRKMAEKAANYGPEIMRSVEKSLVLQMLDQLWKDHLLSLDHLRQGIGLRAYGQRDPLNEYKGEAFSLFEEMLNNLRERVTEFLAHVEFQLTPSEDQLFAHTAQETTETRQDPAFQDGPPESANPQWTAAPVRSRQAAADRDPNDPATWGRIARNAPCPCGTGKKYKHCHGRVA